MRLILSILFLLIQSSFAYCDSEVSIGGKVASPHIIQDEGTSLRPRPYLNMTGSGVACSDSGGKTVCVITGGGGSGGSSPVVKESGTIVAASADTFDFLSGFDITETPTGEANVSIDLSELTLSSFSEIGATTATAGNILVADGTDFETVAMSGDTTITSAGVVTVVAKSISLTDLSDVNTATATAGLMLVADGTDYESVAIGSNKQVIFNDGGSLAGDSGLSFEKTLNSLIVGVNTTTATTSLVLGDTATAQGVESFAMAGGLADGNGSLAIGGWAKGNQSVAFGTDTRSEGQYSVAMGESTTAQGLRSFAMGADSNANGVNSFAGGDTSTALGANSFSFGADCNVAATGTNGFCIGDSSNVSGVNGFSHGDSSSSTGANSVSMAYASSANGDNSVAIGTLASTSGSNSIVLGRNVDNTLSNSIKFAQNSSSTEPAELTVIDNTVTVTGRLVLTQGSLTMDTVTSGNILIADGTDFDSIAMSGDCTITSAGVIDCVSSGGASSLTDLSDVNSATVTAGNILIADGVDFDSVAMSGSCTLASNGVISCNTAAATSLVDLSDVNSATVTAGNLLIADGVDFDSIAVTGDVTITSAGVTTIAANSVALGTDTTGNYAAGIGEGGNALDVTCVDCLGEPEIGFVGTTVNTATAANLLIADGTDFESVALSGDVTITSAGVATVVANSISLADLSDVNTVSATAGVFLVADGTDYESVSMNGSCTMDKGGTVSCVSSGGATSLTDLSDVNSATATSGNILIADGTDFEARSMSGACTMTNEGVISCSSSATSLADLTDVNATTATAGNLLVADGTDWESSSILSVGAGGGITITGDGTQSTITEGLVVNNGNGVDSDDDFQVKGIGTQDLYFDVSTGSLGLGTSTPAEILEVVGDLKITGGSLITNTVTAGNILVADGDSWESVALSGSCTITSAGVASCTGGSVTSLVDLSDVNSATVTAGNLLIADGVDFDSVAMSGACTITSAGVVSCSSSATSLVDLSDVNTATATAGNILIADGTDFESIAMSGSCTIASSGSISCSGGSSKFLQVIRPQQMKLPSGSMAIDAGNTNWRGLFDATSVETASSSTVLYPYGSGGFNGVVVYSMASATSGTVEFNIDIDCKSSGDSEDLDTASYGTVNSFTETVPGTAGYPKAITVTTLNHDSCAQGDYMDVRVIRDATDGTNDTATGDAELRAIYIYEP